MKTLLDYGKSKKARKDFEEEERQANWEAKSARQQVDFSVVQASKNIFKDNKKVLPKPFSIPN